MPAITQIINNIETFIGRKIEDQTEQQRLIDELTSTVTDLIRHPQLPARRRLIALFKRFGVEESVASSLVTSLVTGIEKEREEDFEISTQEIDSIFFPLLHNNIDLVVARAKDSVDMMSQFPEEKVLELVEQAAIPFAQLLGSNVAEALALEDPGAVFRGKTLVQAILQGEKRDPIEIANLFTRLSSDKKLELIDLIAQHLTEAQQRYQARNDDLLRNGQTHQWIYDKLREIHIPHATAKEIVPIISYNFKPEQLDTMSSRQFMKMVIDVISSVSTHAD